MDPSVNCAPCNDRPNPGQSANGDEGPTATALQALRRRLDLPAECDVDHLLVAATRRFDQLDRDQALGEAANEGHGG